MRSDDAAGRLACLASCVHLSIYTAHQIQTIMASSTSDRDISLRAMFRKPFSKMRDTFTGRRKIQEELPRSLSAPNIVLEGPSSTVQDRATIVDQGASELHRGQTYVSSPTKASTEQPLLPVTIGHQLILFLSLRKEIFFLLNHSSPRR